MSRDLSGPVGVISNPGSGHNRDQFEKIRQRLESSPAIVHHCTDSIDDIPAALGAMSDAGVSVLAINGGDGTASAILGQLFESQLFSSTPVIAILPGGTANMNAGDIGISGSLARAVDRFCDWCEGDRNSDYKLKRRALLKVSSPDSGSEYYGMFLGAGAVLQGTDYAHREIHSRGLRDDFGLVLSVLRTVWGILRSDPEFMQHVAMDLALDGAPSQRHDTLILAVSTLQRLAFGMRPFWGEGDGELRVTLMEQGCTRFASTFLSIARGKPNRNAVPGSGYYSYNARNLHLALQGRVNLDGEIIVSDSGLDISLTPTLEFLSL
ncbi:MAG: diacylglycerol kinase family protein [Halieaceae bacterium]